MTRGRIADERLPFPMQGIGFIDLHGHRGLDSWRAGRFERDAHAMRSWLQANRLWFPFTRYGAIKGALVTVSNDAAIDEHLGLIYPSRVKLARTFMRVDARDIALSPGMGVTVEIKTGRRRLIEYFLSPMLQAIDESGRER